ncbi:FHA domain-containing protein [Trinickia fusca]|nr:FHA domain-containing protein [Trinickia fusca]
MLLELRVLSGLHKGACLPLGEHAISIGSGEDADVVLLDEGVATQHVLIELQCLDRWMLRAVDAAIVDAKGHEIETIEVAQDEPARVRLKGTDVWLDIVPPQTQWAAGELLVEEDHAHVDPHRQDALATIPAVPGDPRESHSRTPTSWPKLAIAFGVTAAVALGMATVWRVASIASNEQARPAAASETAAASSAKRNAERAIAALKELLRDRSLEQQVQYRFHDGKLRLDAILDSDQLSRFEPIVAILRARFSREMQIETHVSSIEQSLPFHVVQVVAGPIPEVLTDDGHRLFLGDSIDGYTLVAVKNDAITFDGKRHVELPW